MYFITFIFISASREHFQRRTTSSEDDPSSEAISGPHCVDSRKITSLALQIVDSDQDTKSSLTLAQEMASFEYIDEKSGTVSSPSSLASDYDVWSPREKYEIDDVGMVSNRLVCNALVFGGCFTLISNTLL